MKSSSDEGYESIYNGTETRCTKEGLKQEMEYMFRIYVLCGSEMSGWSKPIAAKVQKNTAAT